jgi:hypothetical protein
LPHGEQNYAGILGRNVNVSENPLVTPSACARAEPEKPGVSLAEVRLCREKMTRNRDWPADVT